jgi:putative copper export protein
MVTLLPAEGRRLPVVPPAVPVVAVAALGFPLLVAGMAEAVVPTRADSLRLTGAVGAFAGYAGLVLAVGIIGYAVLLHRRVLDNPRVRFAVTAGWVLGLTGAITRALVAAADATGARISALGPGPLSVAAGDPEFRAKAAAVALWTVGGLAVVALRTGGGNALARPVWQVLGPVLALELLRFTSVTADRSLDSTTTVASLVHLGAMTLWLGGLVTLLLERDRMSQRDLRRVLPRFSRLAFGAVTAVVITGIVLAVAYLATPADLFGTGYGRLLLAKTALLAAILVAARRSQRWVARHLPTNPPTASHGSVRTLWCAVTVEICLAVAVLGVAAALVTAPGG